MYKSCQAEQGLSNTKTRIEAIDIAKGIGILLVIFGHICTGTDETYSVKIMIYSFHMPLFFLISGYCFNNAKYDSFKKFLVSRLKTIICPYLLFSFFHL